MKYLEFKFFEFYIFRAFQWEPPKYAHLPVLLNEDGSKLSKRHDDLTVDALRKNHIYPLALINFLTLCGGGFLKTSASEKITHLKSLDELASKVSYFYFTSCCQEKS